MKLGGRLATWTGGLIVFISFFVERFHYSEEPGFSAWHISTRGPLLFTLLVLAAVALSILAIFFDLPLLVAVQAAIGIYLFGLLFPIGGKFIIGGGYQHTGAGFWLSAVGSLAMAVGGGLSVAAIWPRAWPATTGWDTSAATRMSTATNAPTPLQTPAQSPPAGWYPDPSGSSSKRYWSGVAWTDRVAP